MADQDISASALLQILGEKEVTLYLERGRVQKLTELVQQQQARIAELEQVSIKDRDKGD